MNYLFVAFGGMLGAVARYFCVSVLADKSTSFPFSTFVVNILGCFLIGGLSEFFALKAHLPQEARIFLITGFLGAFTTFSTFGLDAVGLINKFAFLHMLVYVSSSVVLGICSIYAAGFVVRRLFL